MAAFVPVAEVEPKEFIPVEEVSANRFVPVEEVLPEAKQTPTMRPAIPAPGEAGPQLGAPPVSPIPQSFPGQQQAASDAIVQGAQRQQQAEVLAQQVASQPKSQAAQQAMLTGVAQPESEIQPIGKEGSFLRGATSVAASVLNRPEYLAALANPATAVAVGVSFLPGVAKQFTEDLGKAAQGDNEALGRAAAIGIPALVGGIKGGKGITERLAAQTQLEKLQGASNAAHIDAMARQELTPKAPEKPTVFPLAQAELNKLPGGKENAVSERIAAPPVVGETPGSGPEVGARVSEPETPALPQVGREQQPQPAAQESGAVRDVAAEPFTPVEEVSKEVTQTNEDKIKEKGLQEVAPNLPAESAGEGGASIPATTNELAPAGQVEPAGATAPKSKQRGVERPTDIIDTIIEKFGSIRSKKYSRPGSEGYYSSGYDNARSGAGRELFKQTGSGPDEVLDGLRREGYLPQNATVDDLWDAIHRANGARRAHFRGETPEVQADKFNTALRKQQAKKGSHVVSVGDLSVGDTFAIGGEKLTVMSIDADTGDVTVKDGRKFGYQTIPDGADLSVEKGSLEVIPKVPSFQEEDFALNAPESVEQQKARLAHEEALAKQKESRAKMDEFAAKPFVGSQGDIGQRDMFGGGDLLSMGPGAASPADISKPGDIVSNMFSAIDRDRAELGKPPMEPGDPRTWSEDQKIASAKMNRDPQWIPDLIKEVTDKPRPLLSWEQAGTVMQKAFWKAEANNALRRMANAVDSHLAEEDLVRAKADVARFEDNLQALEDAVGRGGTGSEAGRTLQAQKMGLNDELTLVEMRLEARGKLGGRPLTKAESVRVAQIHKEYEAKISALEKATAEADKRKVDAETRAALAEIGRQAAEAKVPTPLIQRLINRVGQTIHDRANAARDRLKGKLFTLSPDVLKDLAEIGADNIWTIGEDFGRWSAKMIEDVGERVKPHLQAIWEASKKLVTDTWDAQAGPKAKKPAPKKVVDLAKQTIKKGDSAAQQREKLTARIVDRSEKGQTDRVAPAVQKLARTFVQEGIHDREALIDAIHGVLEDAIPDWTRRQTMDAISGYGDYKTLSKDEISVRLRDLKGQMQQIAKLEDMGAGDAPLRTGLERREVTKAQSELIKLVNEAKRRGGYETTDPARQLRTALDEVKKRTQSAIDDYEKRIAEGDYGVRKTIPITPDAALLNKQAELKRTRKKWEQQKRDWELGQRKGWQRTLDRFVRWERAFKLSSPVVFGKLAGAALTRFVETAASETAGGILGLAPGIRQVARQAPREGGFNVKAMANGFVEAWRKGVQDAAQTLLKGAADIDVMYGEKLIDKDWANFFGQLHGMLKAPVKRAEFELSLQKRTEHAIRIGLDPSNPLVSARLHAEALNDGYRSIFMQRGFSSDMFNQVVAQMERSKKYPIAGEVSARVARFLMPVVRVPANIVAETGTGIYGVPMASMRTMFHAVNGTLNKLDPVVADSIMRQFKKGSIGMGLIAIGYFAPEMVGGYDWREKRKPGAVKTGGFQVGGTDIPRWLTHAPWFDLMQFGATIRHAKDKHVHGAPQGISEGMWAAGLGLVEETPFVGQMLRVDKVFGTPSERTQYLGELAKSTLLPQAVIKAAELTDDSTKRKPATIGEHLKMGVPGLRQEVKPKPATKAQMRLNP